MAAAEDHRLDAGRQFGVGGERMLQRRDSDVGGQQRVADAVEHRVVVVEMSEQVVGATHRDQLTGNRHADRVEWSRQILEQVHERGQFAQAARRRDPTAEPQRRFEAGISVRIVSVDGQGQHAEFEILRLDQRERARRVGDAADDGLIG